MANTLTYNFACGPDHHTCLEMWTALKPLFPAGLRRTDIVLIALNRGILTEAEASLLTAWLAVFQTEDFAQ